LFSRTYSWFIDPKHSFHLPGAPYYLAAALLFTACLLATRTEKQVPAVASLANIPDVIAPDVVGSGTIGPLPETPKSERF
jgi:hypothetical protein